MKKKKTNKLLILVLLLTTVILSVGASSWLIITENEFLPTVVTKIKPVIEDTNIYEIYEGETYNSNYHIAVAGTRTAKDNGNTITGGTFSLDFSKVDYERATAVENKSYREGEVKVTYTPSDSNYANAEITATVRVYPVARIETDSGTVYYGTVEEAIVAAGTSKTAEVLPNLYAKPSATSGATYVVKIKNDCTLNKGATLALSYELGTTSIGGTDVLIGDTPKMQVSSDATLTCKSEVNLSAKLTINGRLTIGGQYYAGGASTIIGRTVGQYAQLNIKTGGSLQVNGTVNCMGYIKNENAFVNNGTDDPNVVFNSGSTVMMPFVLYEFRGGTISTGMQKDDGTCYTCPFFRYAFVNIHGAYRIYGGATAKARASMTASKISASADADVISTSTGSLITLTNSSSVYMDLYYDSSNTLDNKYGTMNIDFYGGAKLNSLSITKDLKITKIEVSSKDAYLPISYLYNISLNNGTYDATSQNLKILPGGNLTVNDDATLNASNIICYSNTPQLGTPGRFVAYPTDFGNKESGLYINGVLNVDNLGGTVDTTNTGAQLNINVSNSLSDIDISNSEDATGAVNEEKYGNYYYLRTYETANGLLYTGNDDSFKGTLSIGQYESINAKWRKVGEIGVTFNANDGTDPPKTQTITIPSGEEIEFPTLIRDYYDFMGWYLDSGCTQIFAEATQTTAVFYTDLTLYAGWMPIEYTLNFEYKYDDGFTPEAGKEPELPNVEIKFTVETTSIEIPETPASEYKFMGWFKKESCEQSHAITSISGAELLANGTNNTIYGLWTTTQYVITYQSDMYNDLLDRTQDSFTASQLETAKLPNMQGNDTAEDKAYYFGGWYYGEVQVSTYIGDTGFIDINNASNTEYVLTAKWIKKYALTVIANSNATNGTKININKTVYYISFNDIEASFNDQTADAKAQDNDGSTDKYFVKWQDSNNNQIESLTSDMFDNENKALTITAVWKDKIKITIKVVVAGDNSDGIQNATYTLYGNVSPSDTGRYTLGDYDNVAATTNVYYIIPEHYAKIDISSSDGNNDLGDLTNNDWVQVNKEIIATINSDTQSCIVAGTMITLADGTQKAVEDLVVGDMVLAFNHITGKMEAAPIIFNTHIDQPAKEYSVLHLNFENGKVVKIVSSHGFFDMTLLQYVYITESNYTDYIGHQFYYVNENGVNETITLTSAFIQKEITRIFCPVSYFHMNSLANGFLNTPNIPGNITGLVNYFEYDSDLKYNEEKMQADIEKYGLYTYEDFAEYISYEAYLSSPAVYLKVSVGKGMMTYEEILEVIEYLLSGSLID